MDPLTRYPPMMSAYDLAEFLGCSYVSALRQMQTMPYVNIGNGKKNEIRRVSRENVRKRYGLSEPRSDLQIVKGRR